VGAAGAAAAAVNKRPAGTAGTAPVVRNTGARSVAGAEAIRRAQQRRREEEEQKREEERNRVATIAVAICSAVAVIAIIVFLVALFNGALLNQENEYAVVPKLVGKAYSEDFHEIYSDFNIKLRPQEYNNEYKKGQIIKQEPADGSKVFKNTDLYITISLGKEPEVKVMENLIGVPWDNAESFLKGQGFEILLREETSEIYEAGLVTRTDPSEGFKLKDGQTIHVWISTGPEIIKMDNLVGSTEADVLKQLDEQGFLVQRHEEPSDEFSVGQVTRTSPAYGENLTKGQTIKIWISTGPAVIKQNMPGVVGQDQQYAMDLLHDLGFQKVRTQTVESTEPVGTVVTQSHQKGEQIDVLTEILLEVSMGPAPTEPEETGPAMVTKQVTFILPDRGAAYSLNIRLNGNEVIEAQTIPAGTASFTIELTGTGTKFYDLFIDGEPYRTEKVVFTDG
jgi:beta-lactam-binding protein with PASTA domain